jgi:hypothetical protein
MANFQRMSRLNIGFVHFPNDGAAVNQGDYDEKNSGEMLDLNQGSFTKPALA